MISTGIHTSTAQFLCYNFMVCLLSERKRLSEYVRHYESLDYDSEAVHEKHERVRRSASSPSLHLDFQAHSR